MYCNTNANANYDSSLFKINISCLLLNIPMKTAGLTLSSIITAFLEKKGR